MKLPEKNVNDFILKIEQLFEVVKDVKKPSEINQDELYDQFEQHIKDLMYYGIDDISTDLDKSLPNDNGYQMISESERQVFRAGCIKTFDDALRKMGALLSIDGSLSELHKVSQQAVSALKCNPKVAALCPSYTTLSKQQISKLKKPFKQVSPPEEQANIQQLFDQKFGIFYLANEENYLNDIFTMMENEFYHIDMFEIPACVSQSEESLDLDSIPTSEILNQYKDFDEAMRAFKFKKTIQNYCNLLSIYKKHQDRPDIASSEDIKKIMEGYKGIFNATYKDLLAKYAPSSNRGLCPMIRFSEGKSFQALQSELLPKLEEAQKGDLFKTKSSNANYLLDALTDFMTNPVYDNYIKLREEMLAFPEYKQDDDLNDVIKQLADVCLIVSKLNRGIQYLVVDKKATVDPKLQTIFDEYLTKYSDEDDESISPTHFATIRFELGEYLKNRNIDTFTTLAHAMLDKRSYVDEVPLRNLIYELMAYDKPLQDIQIVVEDLNRKEASERLVLEFLKNNEDFGHQYGETLAALQAYLQDRNEKNYMTLAHSVYENNILNVHAPFYGLILNLGEIDRNIHDFPQLIQKLNGQDLLDYISEHPVDPEIEDFFNQAKVFLVTPTSKVRAKLEQVYQAQLGLDLAPEHLSHIQEMMDSINHIYPELEKSASSTSSSVNSTQDGYTTGEETPSLTSSSSEYSSGDEASFKGKLDKIKSGPNGNESNDEAYPDYTRPTRR